MNEGIPQIVMVQVPSDPVEALSEYLLSLWASERIGALRPSREELLEHFTRDMDELYERLDREKAAEAKPVLPEAVLVPSRGGSV